MTTINCTFLGLHNLYSLILSKPLYHCKPVNHAVVSTMAGNTFALSLLLHPWWYLLCAPNRRIRIYSNNSVSPSVPLKGSCGLRRHTLTQWVMHKWQCHAFCWHAWCQCSNLIGRLHVVVADPSNRMPFSTTMGGKSVNSKFISFSRCSHVR